MKTVTRVNYWPSLIDLILLLLFITLVLLVIVTQKIFIPESVTENQKVMRKAVLESIGKLEDFTDEQISTDVLEVYIDDDDRLDMTIERQERDDIYMFYEYGLFDSGKADLKDKGRFILGKIGSKWNMLNELYKEIRVLGHTDNVRIAEHYRDTYPSNWHLGAARAVEVVNFLENECGISPHKGLSATSHAEYRPAGLKPGDGSSAKIVEARNIDGIRSLNRRIEVILTFRD